MKRKFPQEKSEGLGGSSTPPTLGNPNWFRVWVGIYLLKFLRELHSIKNILLVISNWYSEKKYQSISNDKEKPTFYNCFPALNYIKPSHLPLWHRLAFVRLNFDVKDHFIHNLCWRREHLFPWWWRWSRLLIMRKYQMHLHFYIE